MPGLTIHYTDAACRRRRVRFERRSVGGWERIVEEYSAGEWRPVGREVVADTDIEVDRAVLDDVEVVDEPGGETIRGPGERA
jgi:hypothetical protein